MSTIEISNNRPIGPNRTGLRSNISRDDNAARAPPLDIQPNREVTVVNGDRSNLTWKRYKLIEINQRTGMCLVEGISDSRQRNFPRSVVKPKDWVDSFKGLFRAMALVDDGDDRKGDDFKDQQHHYVEFHNFYHAMQLLGAEYDHDHALKIFKALDVRANGILSFGQFLNWVYGLGRTSDKGRLLTTVECVTGVRKWQNILTYYVMAMGDNEAGVEGDRKQTIWTTAAYDAASSTADTVHLITSSNNDQDAQVNVFQIPKNLDSFHSQFATKLQANRDRLVEVYSPSNEDERECSIVVMGPGEIGKSALINKFVKGVFPHDYDPTIQDHARKQILVDDKPALLDILDTAGQDEFASMRYDWLKDGIDILLICFSRSDHESFIRAEELINISKRLLKQQKTPKIVPILLVGTKKDLSEQMCQVTLDDVQDLRERYGGPDFIGYEECSAFMDDNVTEIFEEAVLMYRKWRSESAGIKIKYPTLREVQARQRQVSYVQQMNNNASKQRRKCLGCLAKFCPAMAAYMESEEKTKKLNIASVPKDKFGDELSEPSYSKQHFFVQRKFSWGIAVSCIIAMIFFPIVITFETLLFVFYCNATNCCFKCLPTTVDFTDTQVAVLYDLFAGIVGRDPREEAKSEDARKWFLSQTCGQKVSRLALTLFIDVIFFFAFFNAITLGFGWFDTGSTDADDLAVVETLGPGQIWGLMWLVLILYMSLDIDVVPPAPSMQALRPYVMYLNADESIRTTAYVFLRGFSKSTFAIFRLEATAERIGTSLFVATVWAILPGLVRVVLQTDGGGKFFPDGLKLQAITAMFVSFTFIFTLVLGLQMQLMSGLVKYIGWMNDITNMLDEVFSKKSELHYINLTRHNNVLAWLEMRTYLYTKGLIIFARQEIFVLYVIFVQVVTGVYTLQRLLSNSSDISETYGSPSFVGILVMFLLLTYSLLRILRTTRMIERLQTKQIALLAAQKFQIYYKRITWHPDKDSENEISEGGDDYDPDFDDIDPNNLPPMVDPVEDDSTDDDMNLNIVEEENGGRVSPVDGNKSENDALLGIVDDAAAAIDAQQTLDLSGPSTGNITRPTRLRLQRTQTRNFGKVENESMFSADYLDQSEKFVQAAINICEAQDIIPRIFNIKVQVAVGLAVLCTSFAVLPTAISLAFGDACAEWQN